MLALKLRLNEAPGKRRIDVVNSSTRDCSDMLEKIPVCLGNIVVRFTFIVSKSLPYDLIIVSLRLVHMHAYIYLHIQTANVRKDENTGPLNPVQDKDMRRL